MYLWNTKKLASDLAEESVGEKDKMLYVLGTQLVITLSLYEALFQNEGVGLWGIYELVVVLLVVVYGVFICYNANGKEKGKNFIDKFICLSLPISIKITLLAWGLGYLLGCLADFSAQNQYRSIIKFYPVISFFLSILLTYLLFWRISWHIQRMDS